MARAQIEALERVVNGLNRVKYQETRKQLELLLEKLRKGNSPKPKSGIGIERAIAAMREVLGDKLAVPRNPSDQWCMVQAKRIRDLGLSEMDFTNIAKCIATKWNPPYSFEYCVRAADRLLAEYPTVVRASKNKSNAPVGMEE